MKISGAAGMRQLHRRGILADVLKVHDQACYTAVEERWNLFQATAEDMQPDAGKGRGRVDCGPRRRPQSR